MASTNDSERARLLDLLRLHGRNTTSFVALGQSFRYLWLDADSCVPFVDTGSAWVAAGAPVAAIERWEDAALLFAEKAREKGRRAVFFATETRFVSRVGAMDSFLVGEQPVWVPEAWPETVRRVRSLREQLRRARAKGVRIERLASEVVEADTRSRRAIHVLIAGWLRARPMAPMAFIVGVEPFRFSAERRYYAAWRGDCLVGFLGLVPIYARGGWLFDDLLREPAAPNGTAELLFDAAMRDLAAEGVTYATFGLAPLTGPVSPWLQRAQSWGRPLYDFAGLRAFKHKLRPVRWEPVYVSFSRGGAPWLVIYDVLRAFSGRGLFRFGVATLLRGPDVIVQLLMVMLVPWTALLAVVAPARWFPGPLVRWAWVAFDVALTIALVALTQRWRRGLATVVALAITADFVVTLSEALAWNLPRVHRFGDALAMVIAVSAPVFASLIMWRARARHSQAVERA